MVEDWQFSASEYERRYHRVRTWMTENALSALVIYSSSYGGDHVRWLTGFPPRHDTYLVLPLDGEPMLLVQLLNHVPNAREIAIVDDVRWGGPDSAETVAAFLKSERIRGAIGLVGRVPYHDYQHLEAALADIVWHNANKAYAELRLIKSKEEIAFLRQGATFTDFAMQALVNNARPGVSELELTAVIEAAYTAAGGQHGIHFLSSTSMAAPDSYVPRQNQRTRVLQQGDIVISELSAGVGGYNGQIHRPIAIGQEPTAHYQHLYEVALEAYHEMVACLKPGATIKELLDVADIIAANNLTVCDDLFHGYGAGYLAPVTRTRQTAHRKQPAEDFVFQENMGIVIQPNVYDPRTGAGLQVGNLMLVTTEGCDNLQRYPMHFAVCG